MGSKFPTPAPTDPEHRKPPAPKGPPPMESVTSLQRELAEARNKRDLDMLLCQLGEMATVSDKSAPDPSDVKGEDNFQTALQNVAKNVCQRAATIYLETNPCACIYEAFAKIESRASLTPLTDPSVRGVLVACSMFDVEGFGLDGIFGIKGRFKLRPASDFGVAAREDEAKEQAEVEDYLWNIARTRNETLTRLAAERAERIKELEAELAKRTQERDEAVPFMAALKGRHNGYDPGYSKMYPDGPPATPEVALNELIEEQEWLVNSELQQAQSDAERQGERIKKLEAERQLSPSVEEALSAINRALLFFRQGDQSGCDGMNEREISLAATAGIKSVRGAFGTEQSMHSAWRKRATEAESDAERLRKAIETHRLEWGAGRVIESNNRLWSALSPSPAAASGEKAFPSDADCDAAWEAFSREHILPNRIFRLALMGESPVSYESKHIEDCKSCGDAFRFYRDQVPPTSAPAAGQTMESAWLLETQIGGSPVWFTSNNKYRQFTTDACAADRFSSKETAEAFASKIRLSDWKATEHGFYGTSAPAAESDKPYGLVEQMDAGEGTVYGRRVTVKRREYPAAETQGNAQHHSEGAKILDGGSGSSAAESEGGDSSGDGQLDAVAGAMKLMENKLLCFDKNDQPRFVEVEPIVAANYKRNLRKAMDLFKQNRALSARLAACEERCKEFETHVGNLLRNTHTRADCPDWVHVWQLHIDNLRSLLAPKAE